MCLKLDLVSRICGYQCSYRTNAGYCGRTAGCVRETSFTYVLSSTMPIPKQEIKISNDGFNYYLYIGGKFIMKSNNLYQITREIEKYEEEHKL